MSVSKTTAKRLPSSSSSTSGNSLNCNNNNNKWKNPFISVISSGPRQRKHINSKSSDFAFYDLSLDESIYNGNSKIPMKEVPDKQKQILLDGKRESYLESRWDISPDIRYFFPEATSMRYGWVHNVRCKEQKKSLI